MTRVHPRFQKQVQGLISPVTLVDLSNNITRETEVEEEQLVVINPRMHEDHLR